MLIVAHRCNSIEKIERAFESGADVCELDLRMMEDDMVLSHDPPGAKPVPRLIEVWRRWSSNKFWLELKEPIRFGLKKALVISFNPNYLRNLDQRKGLILARRTEFPIEELKEIGISWILLRKDLISQRAIFQEAGFRVGVWTVNKDFSRFKKFDAICTDRVEEAISALRRNQ